MPTLLGAHTPSLEVLKHRQRTRRAATDSQLEGRQVVGLEAGEARECLAHFKCPTLVEYVPELPRNATGKVLKTTLRKERGGQETSVQR